MLDISKLERRWFKYKIKKIVPYTLVVVSIALLVFVMPFIVSNQSAPVVAADLNKSPIHGKDTVAKITKNNEVGIVLEPSMNFIEAMNQQSTPTTDIDAPAPPTTKPVPIQKTLIVPDASLPTPTPVIAPTPVAKIPQPTLVKGKLTSIKRDDAAFDIHEIENRFKDSSNPVLGVYLAKYHYDHGNYTEAYNYALKTNSINNNLEDSWLIFAKSLVKLGKEEQAKKTLQLYISNSNSQNAKNYLDSLHKENSK